MGTTILVLVLLSVLGSVSSNVVLAAGDCEASCSGHSSGDKIPNPTDCTQFFICVSETEHTDPFDCGDGKHFNDTTLECDDGAECEDLCSSLCTYECDRIGTYKISDRYDCSSYYQCVDSAVVGPFACPSDKEFFDGFMCQTEKESCCNCKPYCTEEDVNTQILDPTNCTNYFFCLEPGFATIRGTCPSGNYDPFVGHCSETIPCITVCPEVAAWSAHAGHPTCQQAGYHPLVRGECHTCFYHCLPTNSGLRLAELCCPGGTVFCPDTASCTPPADCVC